VRVHKNPFFLSLLALVALSALITSVLFLYHYYSYYVLTKTVPVTMKEWKVLKLTGEHFKVNGSYYFLVGEKKYSGETTFDVKYRNQWAAEQAIKAKLKSPKAWVQPGNENHSTLEKYFPLKEGLSALLLGCLTLYFLWLGVYVAKFQM
jgi:hypothetical protein